MASFSVGDRVRRTDGGTSYEGDTGTVIEVGRGGMIRVAWDLSAGRYRKGQSARGWILSSSLAPSTDSDQTSTR